MIADRHTDRHRDTLITTLRSPLGGGVTIQTSVIEVAERVISIQPLNVAYTNHKQTKTHTLQETQSPI